MIVIKCGDCDKILEVYNSKKRFCFNCTENRKKEYRKKYYQRPEIKERKRKNQREWTERNIASERKRKLEWYHNNKNRPDLKEKWIEKDKTYYYVNKERCNQQCKNYYKNHKQDVFDRANKYNKQKKKENVSFLIKCRLRTNLAKAILIYTRTSKIMSSKKYGIDYEAIINHLKPFPEEITKYHIDHIRPLCSFDLTDIEQVKQAFAPENHRWLLKEENIKKIQQDMKMSIRK